MGMLCSSNEMPFFIMTVVEVGIQELIYQIAVTAMNLYTVESCFTCQIYSCTEFPGHRSHLLNAQPTYQGRTVQIESCAGTNGNASADFLVAHIAAVSQLNAGSSTSLMYAVGEVTQVRNNLRTHKQLTVETQSALSNSSVCYGGHSDTALGNACMVVVQHLTGFVPRAHTFKSCTSDGSVS